MAAEKMTVWDGMLWRMVHCMSEDDEPLIAERQRYYYMIYWCKPERARAVADAIRGRMGDRLLELRKTQGVNEWKAKIKYAPRKR